MKKTKILLVGALLLGVPSVALSLSTQQEKNATVVRAATTTICELTFPDDNKANNKVQDYTSTWNAKSGNYNFEIKNANNNNWNSWKYIRFGSKKNASIGNITTKSAIESVSVIKLTIDQVVTKSIKSIKLEKSRESSFSKIDNTFTLSDFSAGEKEFVINDTGASYYKFTFDCKQGSNGLLQISKIGFYNVSVDENKYSVKFDSDGGTAIDSIDVSNDGQTKVEEPVSPTKKGYIFDGWYNNDTKWNFNDPVKSNMTLKAHWKNIDVTNIANVTVDDEVYRITGKIVARTNGQNYYVQDNTGAILVYASLTSYEINEGDTISITGTKIMYKNCPELKDCFAIEKINEPINIAPITELSDVIKDNVCKYVELKNITLKADFETATNIKTDKNFVIRANTNYFEIKNNDVLKAGDKINLKGVISIFGNEFQVLATYMEKVVAEYEVDQTILTTNYLCTKLLMNDNISNAIRFIGSVNETKFVDLQKVGFNFTLNNTTTKEYNTELSKLYHIIDDSDKAFDKESDEIYVKDGFLNYSLILNNIPDDFTGTITYYAFAAINDVNYQTEAITINLVNGRTESK